MPRGASPATIVPTASDDNIRQSTASEEENQLNCSSQEDDGTTSVVEFAQDNGLQTANEVGTDSAGYLNDAFNKSETTTLTGSTPQNELSTDLQKTKVGKALRQRSQSAVIEKQELTKNYMELIRDFKELQPFTRRPDGTYPSDTLCVYCGEEKPTSVFFPCQHMCVCTWCIQANRITADYSSSADWSACPVCMAAIRLILPHSGREEDKYWTWVLEIKPTLPQNFTLEFKEAGKRLNKNAGAAPLRGRRSSIVTLFRREGTFKEAGKPTTATDTVGDSAAAYAATFEGSKSKAPPFGRRHSWQPGANSTVQNVAASNEHEEAHNCSIL